MNESKVNNIQLLKLEIEIAITENGFKLWVRLSLFDHRKIVTQGSKAGLELLLVKATRLILVEMPGGK